MSNEQTTQQPKWLEHVNAYRAANNCSYKDALKGAKETYVKTVKPKSTTPRKPRIRLLKMTDIPPPVSLPADVKPLETPQNPLKKAPKPRKKVLKVVKVDPIPEIIC